MLVPGWLYFVVFLYFCSITIPNMFAGYKTQNDLIFSIMMSVTKNDIVKAKIAVIVVLGLLHLATAVLYGLLHTQLYPNFIYFFYGPTMGFWGLCFVMLAVFNLIFIPLYYKTAYKYGVPTIAAITGAVLFAGGAEWLGIQNASVFDLFKGAGRDNTAIHLSILISGMVIFTVSTIMAYHIANKQFKKVEI